MQSVDGENRFAPPQAVVADVAVSSEAGVLASRWRRFFGSLIDGIILGLLLYILSLITPWKPFAVSDVGNPLLHFALWNQVFGFALFVAVNGYLLATRGQTVAKAMLGMRIVRQDGSIASFGRSMLRYGVGYFFAIVNAIASVYYLIDALLIFRANRRCLHDEIAGTMVVRV